MRHSVCGALRGGRGAHHSQDSRYLLLILGIVMFVLGRRVTASPRLAEESPARQKIEEIEHRSGLES
jgi:hypothetical protein